MHNMVWGRLGCKREGNQIGLVSLDLRFGGIVRALT